MISMIKGNGVTFKDLENNIFSRLCQLGQTFTKDFLERYDRMLMENRDKKYFRHKGTRQTTIKTVYEEVTYSRAVYEVRHEDGSKQYVYLLDETLELEQVGLISTNMAQLLVSSITEMSYRRVRTCLGKGVVRFAQKCYNFKKIAFKSAIAWRLMSKEE